MSYWKSSIQFDVVYTSFAHSSPPYCCHYPNASGRACARNSNAHQLSCVGNSFILYAGSCNTDINYTIYSVQYLVIQITNIRGIFALFICLSVCLSYFCLAQFSHHCFLFLAICYVFTVMADFSSCLICPTLSLPHLTPFLSISQSLCVFIRLPLSSVSFPLSPSLSLHFYLSSSLYVPLII